MYSKGKRKIEGGGGKRMCMPFYYDGDKWGIMVGTENLKTVCIRRDMAMARFPQCRQEENGVSSL
jgi:hypothetical protein